MKKINKFNSMNGVKSFILILLVSFILINLSMCKTSSESEASQEQFTLTVDISEGVSGTPSKGSNSYTKNETVNYTYQLKSGYKNLIVKLDGNQVNSNGTVTMDNNHTLYISAEVENTVNYTLTTSVGEGVTGTPDTGSQSLLENSTVSYSYKLDDGYHNLIVKLDGNDVGNDGDITMDKDHNLTAVAESGYDIRGKWELNLNLSNTTTSASILETLTLDVEFSGSLLSGNVFINGNKVGKYTVDSEKVKFSYTVPDSTYGNLFYDYVGEFTGNDDMSGDVTVYYDNGVQSDDIKNPEVNIMCKKGKWSGKRKRH